MSTFIAVDGEGYTDGYGTHLYNLLAASDGTYIHDNKGIDTTDALEYLIGLAERHPGSVFVSFYFSYDVNMILKNFSFDLIDRLRKNGFCYAWTVEDDNDDSTSYYGYKIEYFPRKMFRIQKGRRSTNLNSRQFISETTITIWDVFGFFQSSFVKALENCKIGTTEELKSLSDMKSLRADFDVNDIQSIIDYNAMECRLLVKLMQQLDDSLNTCDITLSAWNGAGAIAAALMRKYNIPAHRHIPTKDFEKPVYHAYFGGRIQALKIGMIDATIYGHDLVSAYPSHIRNLPSLANCKQEYTTTYDPEHYPYCVYFVSWRLPHDTAICPFPFRNDDGSVEYPTCGAGYYWSEEVGIAIKHFGDAITVNHGYAFVPENAKDGYIYYPFKFVNGLFEDRKRFKLEGNHAQLVLKLGLNSLYGKTAQGIGYANTRPAFQSYIWAGMITANTRSRMLDLAMTKPDTVIAFCTDGVYSTEQLAEDTRDVLGGWECETYDNFFILKPGFYSAFKDGVRRISRLRGFRSSEVSWEVMEETWRNWGVLGTCEFPCRSFIGMKGSADLSKWRQWIDSTKQLSFMPSNGFPELVQDTPPLYRMTTPSYPERISVPYTAPDYTFTPSKIDENNLGD